MSRIRITTDTGDWSTLPSRIELAVVVLVVSATAIGLATAAELISLEAGLLMIAAASLLFYAVFDRRRPWWPEEPGFPIDPIGGGAKRSLRMAVVLGAVVCLALALGVTRL